MELTNAKITILINTDQTTIEVYDDNAVIRFLKITLTPEQLSQALSRLAFTKCKAEIVGLDKIGKTREHKEMEFELPNVDVWSRIDHDEARKIGQRILDAEGGGWICDGYFGSQNSFFSKDEKPWARCMAVRWVDKETNPDSNDSV